MTFDPGSHDVMTNSITWWGGMFTICRIDGNGRFPSPNPPNPQARTAVPHPNLPRVDGGAVVLSIKKWNSRNLCERDH